MERKRGPRAYLYRLGPQGFVPATKKPLGDLAWAYFKSRPERRRG